ncbi:MAG: glycosyltransferase family 4 protein [Gomphosphaeria aponina SAG 52.96 = DSM 107014]|uniref:Glycosyltransferase family 4 protein n=1 Tax=Gomphosphaeria aponina SAG 52.96 = DSM 107014 TaxID=1521640 RepID=A0A941JRI4_9CHRO|nr:glycosyltransferase family 4 protein [Gomphosphaeria aponina SAG 52.96 = DSM 107014]
MKILYFYQYFTSPKGSWGTRVYEFARRWVKAGDSVTVVTSVYDKSDLKPNQLISQFDVDGIDVRVINIRLSNKHGFVLRVFTFVAYAVIASWYALVLPADVVVSSSGPITVGIPGMVAHYLRKRPWVFEVRDLWPEGAIQLGMIRNPILITIARFFEQRCYSAASGIVALSPGMAEWIKENYKHSKIEVIPNASDRQLFGTMPENIALPSFTENKKLILYTGTMGKMNNCWQIIKMAEYLQEIGENNLEIVLIGDGKEKAELESYTQKGGIKNIHFLGILPKEEIVGWLQKAHCALMVFAAVPCLDTVSPNKMFDAFAAGVPVIQTTQGWIKQLLLKEQCGLTVMPEDPKAMAEAVLALVNNEALREKQAANARRVAQELFDRDLLGEKMRAVLGEIINQVV